MKSLETFQHTNDRERYRKSIYKKKLDWKELIAPDYDRALIEDEDIVTLIAASWNNFLLIAHLFGDEQPEDFIANICSNVSMKI